MTNSPDSIPAMKNRRDSTRVVVMLVIFIAIALRLWGLDFGLPQQFHPDEPVVVTRAEYGVASNDWNPKAFQWPSLQIYILGAEYEIWYLGGRIAGDWQNADPEFMSYCLHAQGGFYYLGRLTTLLFGVGCVWLMFLLARRFLGTSGSIAAAFLLAVQPIMVRHSRYITPDIPAEFFSLAALIFIDRLYIALRSLVSDDKSRRPVYIDNRSPVWLVVMSAIMIGLATGTKYPAAILAIPLLGVILFGRSNYHPVIRIVIAIMSGAIVLLTFLVTTPFAIFDFGRFVTDIATITWHMKTGHIGMEASGGIWLSSLRQFFVDSGQIWTVISMVGAIIFLARDLKRMWPMTIAFVLILVGLAPLQVFSDRYLVPLIPFMVLGVSWLIEVVTKLIDRGKSGQRLGAVVATILAIALAGQGIDVAIKDAYRLTLPDTRTAAYKWVVENIPAGSSIVEEQGGPNLSPVELAPLAPEPTYRLTEITPLFFRGGSEKDPGDILTSARPEWVISSSQVRDRYMRPGAVKEYPDLVAVFRMYYGLIDKYLPQAADFRRETEWSGRRL